MESLGRCPEATETLCRLAERLTAPLVDLAGESQGRPSVPGGHPLDMSGARHEVVGEADVVLALDVSSFLSALGDTDRSTRETRLLNESARVISISLDDYAVRSWAQTFQSLAPVDLGSYSNTAAVAFTPAFGVATSVNSRITDNIFRVGLIAQNGECRAVDAPFVGPNQLVENLMLTILNVPYQQVLTGLRGWLVQ